jgi:glycosyltransferase involved in cell wall biosynthesis
MSKPVISTTVGAEGLPIRDGKELLIADRPEDFAQSVIRALGDAQFAAKIGERARTLVCERFGWERAAQAFMQVCEQVANRPAGKRAA